MPVWSSLRAPAAFGARLMLNNVKQGAKLSAPVRQMGGENNIFMVPSRYSLYRFKDEVHFYVLLAVIPLGAFVAYCNIVIGPAELKDTPEDYVPEAHEYLKSPVSRKLIEFFGNTAMPSYEKQYESTMYWTYVQVQKARVREQNYIMKKLMKERQDQYNYYFVPAYAKIDDREEAHRYRDSLKRS